MIAAKIEQVSRRNVDDILDERLTPVGCLRSRDGSFEQRSVAQARQAAMRRNDLLMNRFHRLDGEKPEILLRQGV